MILVINSGSTSLKYGLFDENEKEIKSGGFNDISDHEQGVKKILQAIGGLQDIRAVGHRIVHGGDKYYKPMIVGEKELIELEKFNYLAPLHNPFNLAGIRAAMGYLPEVPQIAVFDTAFYHDLPQVAREYALPKEIRAKYNIKKFGFHGISHKFIMEETAVLLDKPQNKINLISCHLGGGWSVTAVKNGKPVDTSMGWTPSEGLVMMTRTGDIDPGAVVELIRMSGESTPESACDEISDLLNKESGIKGLSGGISDFRSLLKEMSSGNEAAKLAFDIATYRLSKYIASYFVALNGLVDAIVFTGAIGSGDPITRRQIANKLKFLGDVKILDIKTNEEIMIAREIQRLLKI